MIARLLRRRRARRQRGTVSAAHKVLRWRARAQKAKRLEEMKALKQERQKSKMARRHAAKVPDDVQEVVAGLLQRPEGLPLDAYAHRISSQHGEDGLTVEVFRRAGIEHRRAVEIGCGANGGNAGVLIAGLGFEALLLDGDEELTTIARKYLAGQPARVEQAWITRETVNGLLAEHGFDENLDYLGIDLDGVDYWIWEALTVRPRVLLGEYNPFFGPDAAVTVPYVPDFVRSARDESGRFVHEKGYYGASLPALERLGRRKGYRLIGTAPASENAYFVRDDIDAGFPEVSAAVAWRPRTKGKAAAPRGEGLYARIQSDGPSAYFEARDCPLVEVV